MKQTITASDIMSPLSTPGHEVTLTPASTQTMSYRLACGIGGLLAAAILLPLIVWAIVAITHPDKSAIIFDQAIKLITEIAKTLLPVFLTIVAYLTGKADGQNHGKKR